jgi:hypothetical protein
MNPCIHKPRAITQRLCSLTCDDQAMLALLLITVAWIPANFRLAFYTSQIAPNTAQDGRAARRRNPLWWQEVLLAICLHAIRSARFLMKQRHGDGQRS